MCKFATKSSFSSFVQHKNRKTNNSTYLVSVKCSEAGGRKRARSPALFLLPASHIQLTQDRLNCFSIFMLYIAWKRGLPQKFASFVLFHPIKKRSFNLLCVLELSSERRWSTLFHFFFSLSLLGQRCNVCWVVTCLYTFGRTSGVFYVPAQYQPVTFQSRVWGSSNWTIPNLWLLHTLCIQCGCMLFFLFFLGTTAQWA